MCVCVFTVCWEDVWETVLWSVLKGMFLRGRWCLVVLLCFLNAYKSMAHNLSVAWLIQSPYISYQPDAGGALGTPTDRQRSLRAMLYSPSSLYLTPFSSSLSITRFFPLPLNAYSCLSCRPCFSFSLLCSDYSDQNKFISISAFFSRDNDITYQLSTNRDERIQ